ncbi:hypothetical protein Tco_0674866 [Tanacetum coccineum]
MSDSDESGITHTEVSSPFEDLSDIGSPRADDHEFLEPEDPYVEAALQAPPSPDYVPGPEEPEHAKHTNDAVNKSLTDAPIIEEYESDSDDDCVSIPLKEIEQHSFVVDSDKHVKTSRENVKDKHTHSQYPKVNKKDLNESKRVGLGYGFTRRACFVCGSFSHLIRDCDYHEKRMAKQVELNKQKMAKGNGSGESKPKWNNVQRMNHQNQFVPTAVLTRTGRIPVNTARPSSTNKVSTARQNSSQAVFTAGILVNTASIKRFVLLDIYAASDLYVCTAFVVRESFNAVSFVRERSLCSRFMMMAMRQWGGRHDDRGDDRGVRRMELEVSRRW